MNRLSIRPDELRSYTRAYHKAKTNKYFSVNTTQYKYMKMVKLRLYDMDILCSDPEAYILCSIYFKDDDPGNWKGKVFYLYDTNTLHDLINSCEFISVKTKEELSKTSE